MAQSQNQQPNNQDLIRALKAMMEGPIEKYESHAGKDHALTMKAAMRKAFSTEDYARFLWRLRYRGRREER